MRAIIFSIAVLTTQVFSLVSDESLSLTYNDFLANTAGKVPPLKSKPGRINRLLSLGQRDFGTDSILAWIVGANHTSLSDCETQLKKFCNNFEKFYARKRLHGLQTSCRNVTAACSRIITEKDSQCTLIVKDVKELLDRITKARHLSFPQCIKNLLECFFYQVFCDSSLEKLCVNLTEYCFRSREQDMARVAVLYALETSSSMLDYRPEETKGLCLLSASLLGPSIHECINPLTTFDELAIGPNLIKTALDLLKIVGPEDFLYALTLKFGITPKPSSPGNSLDYGLAFLAECFANGYLVKQKCVKALGKCPLFGFLQIYQSRFTTLPEKQPQDPLFQPLGSSAGPEAALNEGLQIHDVERIYPSYSKLGALSLSECHHLLAECFFLGFWKHTLQEKCRNVVRICYKVSHEVYALLRLEETMQTLLSQEKYTLSGCSEELSNKCQRASSYSPETLILCLDPENTCRLLSKLINHRCTALLRFETVDVSEQKCKEAQELNKALDRMCKSEYSSKLKSFLEKCKTCLHTIS